MEVEETVSIPIRVVKSTHRDGFFQQVRELSASCCTMREAYEIVSNALEEHGLALRYSSFESFRCAYYTWAKGNLGKY